MPWDLQRYLGRVLWRVGSLLWIATSWIALLRIALLRGVRSCNSKVAVK